jgi:hypothetical protein
MQQRTAILHRRDLRSPGSDFIAHSAVDRSRSYDELKIGRNAGSSRHLRLKMHQKEC